MAIPKVCEDCLKWEQFQHGCWVYWEAKKECTQKVETAEEMSLQKQLLLK